MAEPEEYIVEQRMVGTQTYIVHATSKAEAIRIVRAGDGDSVGFEINYGGAYTATATGAGDTRGRNPLAPNRPDGSPDD